MLARYPDGEPVLASGFLQGEKLIKGKTAALDVELGSGHVDSARLPARSGAVSPSARSA